MKQIILNIEDEKLDFFLELLEKFKFVEIADHYHSELDGNQKLILNERLERYKKDPKAYKDWEDITQELIKKYEL